MLWNSLNRDFLNLGKIKINNIEGCVTSFPYYTSHMLVSFTEEEVNKFKNQLHELRKIKNKLVHSKSSKFTVEDILLMLKQEAYTLNNDSSKINILFRVSGSIWFFYCTNTVPEFKIMYGYNKKTNNIDVYTVFSRGKEIIINKINFLQKGITLNIQGGKKRPHTSKRIKKH